MVGYYSRCLHELHKNAAYFSSCVAKFATCFRNHISKIVPVAFSYYSCCLWFFHEDHEGTESGSLVT